MVVRYALSDGPCTVCRRPTQELPYSYSLGIRLCSASCSYYLLRVCPGDVDEYIAQDWAILSTRPDNMDDVYALMLQATPYLEGTAESPMYRPSGIHDALKELYAAANSGGLDLLELNWKQRAAAMPIFMAMAETLQDATRRYRAKKELVEARNRSLLAAIARENKVTFDQLITSRTLVRYVNTFARDLTCMTLQAWATISEACLAEIQWLRTPKARIRCTLCRPERKQTYTWAGLQAHMRAIHPELHSTIALKVHICALCPNATRFPRSKDLKYHVRNVHSSTRTDL